MMVYGRTTPSTAEIRAANLHKIPSPTLAHIITVYEIFCTGVCIIKKCCIFARSKWIAFYTKPSNRYGSSQISIKKDSFNRKKTDQKQVLQ
jgi:hypothetical protein